MLSLAASNTEHGVQEFKKQVKARLKRIEVILVMSGLTPGQVYVLLNKTEAALQRARVAPRIKRLIRSHHDWSRHIKKNTKKLVLK